jgi:hypothetical protein
LTTDSSGPGQPTPDQTPEPSSDGKSDGKEEPTAATKDASPVDEEKPKTDDESAKDKADGTEKEEKKAEKDEVAEKDADNDDAKSEAPHCESDSDDAVSVCSSVVDSDFSWNSDMDGPGADSSDDEEDAASAKEDDMYADDPWNARCVIGLRVCSHDPDAAIDVVHGKKALGTPE